jgi:hypothetical protein
MLRKRRTASALFLLLSINCAASLFAQGPANDHFENAAVLSGTFVEGRVALTNATIQPGEPLTASGLDQTAWYTWTAPESGTATFNAVGNGGRQVSAAVYFGNWPELRVINYALNTTAATLKFPVAKGQMIYFQVALAGHYIVNTRPDTAFWTISLQTIGSIMDGLNVAGPATVESDSFSSPVVLSGENSSGITYPLWAEHGPTNPNDAGYNNSWYKWTAPHPGTVRVKAACPWPTFVNGLAADKKTIGVFSGPDLPNLTTITTARGTGEILATFEAIAGQTYYISVGKQTTDSILGWVITSLTLAPRVVAPVEIERAVRLRVATSTGKRYQIQSTQTFDNWQNVGDSFEGTGSPLWLYSPTTELSQSTYRVLEMSP